MSELQNVTETLQEKQLKNTYRWPQHKPAENNQLDHVEECNTNNY